MNTEREGTHNSHNVYCVTGGTGFIAAFLVKSLLHSGHTVRTTVRDPENLEKVGFLWELEGAKERLSIYKADLTAEGSFDDAIHGVDGVFHTAGPAIAGVATDVAQEVLIDPFLKGVTNVLNSCKKASSTVKRVVLTSSCSAICYRYDIQQVSPLNESHWSDLEYCKRYELWYAYAKTLSEKEAWRIAKENGIDLVVVNPSLVVGPLLTPMPTSTLAILLGIVTGELEYYPNQTIGFVHIDDVTTAHILAMENTNASGRLICSGEVAHFTEIVEMLKTKYPMYPYGSKCGNKEGDSNPHDIATSKIMELGLPGFKTIPDMFDDFIKSFRKKGFL